jgi:hypothetical protein
MLFKMIGACGDNIIQANHGEECDSATDSSCNSQCKKVSNPSSKFDLKKKKKNSEQIHLSINA